MFAGYTEGTASWLYNYINNELSIEYGLHSLGDQRFSSDYQIEQFLLNEKDTEKVLDLVDLSMHCIDDSVRKNNQYAYANKILISADEAIEELNYRFKESGVGYEYINGKIIRIDSRIMHEEIIRPTLILLGEKWFEGANQEFLSAFNHYRHGRNKEAIVDALKAFESTMKTICEKRCWSYKHTDTCSKLLTTIFNNKLIPDYMQSQFTSLKALLESGVTTVRNKTSAHGQGPDITDVPDHFVSFALNSAATAITLLASAEKALP